MSSLDRLSLSQKLATLGVLFLAGFAAFAWRSETTVTQVGVGGPVYERIIRSKDIIADVLPPPEYIIETHLLVHQATTAGDRATLDDLVRRSRALRVEYEQRHDYWERTLATGPLKDALVARSYAPARDYFDARDRDVLPALEAGDSARARELLASKLEPLYQAHRKAIDEVVVLANAAAAEEEAHAKDDLRRDRWTLLGLASVVVLILLFAGRIVRRAMNDLQRQITAVTAVARRVADGDLSPVTVTGSAVDTRELVGTIRSMTEGLGSLVRRVQQASAALTATASRLTSTSREQDATVRTLSSSAEDSAAASAAISETSRELQKTMRDVADLSERAATVAESGRVGLGQMRSSVESLEKATSSISSKLGTIRDRATDITGVVTTMTRVAEQTNLLSVNAAIEAEKAGEQGRGFLVVAREIRRLADQSAVASLDIDHMVRQMQSAVSSGVSEMDRFGDNVERVSQTTTSVGSQLGEVIERMKSLSTTLGSAHERAAGQAEDAERINDAMAALSAGASQTAASVTELRGAAGDLEVAVKSLREEISRFAAA